jgi:HK97 family phage major capsid protein
MGNLISGDSPAGDTFPVAFGDFASGYQVVDRVGLQIMRDDYTGAGSGIVKFHARRRVGGKVILPEAIAVLKAAVSGS